MQNERNKTSCISGVTNKLLKNHTADLDETLRAHRAYPESVQRHIFDFRSKPKNRFSQFSQNIKYMIYCISYEKNISIKDMETEVDTYRLRKRRVH